MKTHKLIKDHTCRVQCSCGYMSKRRGYEIRHIQKNDPQGWDKHIQECTDFLNQYVKNHPECT